MRTEHPATPQRVTRTHTMDRRGFLRLGGTGLAGAILLGTASEGSGRALAQIGPSLAAEFEAAAKEYGVPKELLLAVGYVNTLWEMPPPDASPYEPDDLHGRGAYGIMQLVRRPSKDTLGRAASLTGLAEEKLKTSRAANVRGGAAVLADMAGGERPSGLDGWYDIVAGYGSGPLYANEVYGALQRGASAKISTGERLELAPQPGAQPRTLFRAQASADYPGATWYGNNGRNYSNRERGPAAIDKIVVHVAQGTYSGTLGWFRNPDNTGSSAHYTVSKYGAVGQSVRDEDIAWHAGWWKTNRRSIGVEHAGYVGDPSWFTKEMYNASAKLSAWLSRKYGVPVDRRHIIGHHEVPGCPGAGGGVGCHTDPGRYWDWDRYLRRIKYYR